MRIASKTNPLLETFNFLQNLIQPKPPINMQRNNPTLNELPSDIPTESPGKGSQLAPGGRRFHVVWSSAKFVHLGWARKFGCSTIPSCHCRDDFTCPPKSSPTLMPLPKKRMLESRAIATKVILGDSDKRFQSQNAFSGTLIRRENQNAPRLARKQQISRRNFLPEYRLNHSGCWLLSKPASIALNASHQPGRVNKNLIDLSPEFGSVIVFSIFVFIKASSEVIRGRLKKSPFRI